VRVRDRVMRYRRVGAGRPLVVLRGAADGDALWPELDAPLAARFRVLVPELPEGCDDLAAWIGAFLEGVGLDRVTLLAAEPCCLAALEVALLDPHRVERLALVPAGVATETGLDGTLATTLAGATVPLLVVRRGLPADEAIPLLRHFLEHGREPAPAG
jgi:pimeloyl-ACP methyl ester carboxylesterase